MGQINIEYMIEKYVLPNQKTIIENEQILNNKIDCINQKIDYLTNIILSMKGQQ